MGGAIAGALGGLAAVPEEWRTAVTEGSRTNWSAQLTS
jgi:ADP-ribosylglycohydrolase